MAKELNQNWLWPFVPFQFLTNFNVTRYDGDIECFSDFDNSIFCASVQVFWNAMKFLMNSSLDLRIALKMFRERLATIV